ncbi:adenosylcobinamide-GDP ribazoletransferase [Pelagibius marinus]|uniref:adenosylcobinamide-GDP ribazoletransferase n=1 Tax=Pelagibius marinus TaxID=2762760 RepID=UPI0018727377|nr:adenosylcobinamide-GDP ribazoletransferase [Pelagibius marinus]
MHFPSLSGFWSPRRWGADLLEAARLLTRLPLPRPTQPGARASHSSRCYPLVGVGVGLVAGLGFAAADWLALPPFAAALAALTLSILVTGALHEDGLADVADGFGGGRDRARKLAIMRDSRIGSYGVLALILVLAARGGSLIAIAESPAGSCAAAAALVAAHSLSRAGLAPIMWALPQARSDGLAAATGRPGGADALAAAVIGAVIALLLLDLAVTLVAVLAVAVLQGGLALQARRQIGGVTGDVLGAAQQLGEAAVLLVACASLSGGS